MNITQEKTHLIKALKNYKNFVTQNLKLSKNEITKIYSIRFHDVLYKYNLQTKVNGIVDLRLFEENKKKHIELFIAVKNYSSDGNTVLNSKEVSLSKFSKINVLPAFLSDEDFDWVTLDDLLKDFNQFKIEVSADKTKPIFIDLGKHIISEVRIAINTFINQHKYWFWWYVNTSFSQGKK